ncbi:MAG: hypothetical protein KatS3mg102_2366 [Planctomycetota bacterium]|nr:MAG: hypothetical protein KatS3mg102_2366 [Planctomycetota bacterium]
MSSVGGVGEPGRIPLEAGEPESNGQLSPCSLGADGAPPSGGATAPGEPAAGPSSHPPLAARGGPPASQPAPLAGGLSPSLVAALGVRGLETAVPAGERSPLPATLEAQRAQLLEMAEGLRVLEERLKEAEHHPIELKRLLGDAVQIEGAPALRLKAATEKVTSLRSFLVDFAELVGIMATARGVEMIGRLGVEGAIREINGYSLERLRNNLTPLIGPWRANGNDWITDFFGHPALGFAMASYFREQGYSRLVSFVGAALADLVWEFGIEGWEAEVEWNDLVTTGVVGALAGSVLKDARVGPFELKPAVRFDPRAKTVAVGFTVGQELGPHRRLDLSVLTGREGVNVGAGLELGERLGVFAEGKGQPGEKGARSFGAGVRLRFGGP